MVADLKEYVVCFIIPAQGEKYYDTGYQVSTKEGEIEEPSIEIEEPWESEFGEQVTDGRKGKTFQKTERYLQR